MTDRLDPFFNNPIADRQQVIAKATPPKSELVAADEIPPKSPTSNKPMTLCEGQFGGKVFKIWADLENRLAVPVRSA